jgi:hypothetical protein
MFAGQAPEDHGLSAQAAVAKNREVRYFLLALAALACIWLLGELLPRRVLA